MPDKVFIDTNILIYAYSETEPEKKDRILTILETNHIVISTQVINEFIWVMNKKHDIDLQLLKVLSDKFWQIFDVALLNKSSIDRAIDIATQYKFSYWDSLIISSALEKQCGILYTEDLQHKIVIDEKINIINPFEL